MTCLFLCSWFWVEVFPCIWWGLVIAIVIIWSLYIIRPLIKTHIKSKSSILEEQHRHEKEMKDDAHEREKEWYFIKKIEKPLEIEKELIECKRQLENLKKKEKDLNKGSDALNKEKEKFQKTLLEEKIKIYEKVIKTIKK